MRIVLALAATLVAAGCIGPDDAVESAGVDEAAGALPLDAVAALAKAIDRNASLDAPAWRVGDAWTVESSGVADGERATLVVVAAEGSSYQLQSTSEQMATFDAMFDVSYLGRIRASDLAGHQQDQPVQFFSFPLAHGKAWTAQWDGLEISLTAGFSPGIPTPLGPQPGFVIQGTTADGQPYVEYDYVPALRWWSHLHFAEGYGIKVTAVSENWTGQYATATAQTLLTLGPGSPPGGTFTVAEGQTTVALTLMGYAEAHARAVALVDPDHGERMGPAVTHSATPAGGFEVYTFPAKPGQWKLAAPTAHHPNGFFAVHAQQVAVAKATL